MMGKLIWTVSIIAVLIRSSCQQAHPSVSPVTTPTGTKVFTPTATTTAIPVPSITPTQTETKIPTSTALLPSPIFTPALITPPPQNIQSIQSMTSPDGSWIAQTSFEQQPPDAGGQYHVQFKIFRQDGTKTWTLVDYWAQGLGYSYTNLHHWSHDSLYFYSEDFFVPDSPCIAFPVVTAWRKTNVKTGQSTPYILPRGSGHAISPDDATLAYLTTQSPVVLHLRNTQSRLEQQVTLPLPAGDSNHFEAGATLWAPDGQALILEIQRGDGCIMEKLSFSLLRVDFPSQAYQILVSNSSDLLWPIKWVLPNSILLRDWNQFSWWIDATNGKPTTSPETMEP